MNAASTTEQLTIEDNDAALALSGRRDEHLRLLEELFGIQVHARGTALSLTGAEEDVQLARQVVDDLLALYRRRRTLDLQDVRYAAALAKQRNGARLQEVQAATLFVNAQGRPITTRTLGQKRYVEAIRSSEIVFCIGPAGTGKTYLAVALAVDALKKKAVSKLVLTRPAVEAGEHLGFLPGDLQEKVDPYLRPLYDALNDLMGSDAVLRALEKGIIEVAPLAYMRGRTLDDAFIILDEAQNTTPEQMKMFLTRLGAGSRMVVTGDVTQIDLPESRRSGLVDATEVLGGIPGIEFVYLDDSDVVRHELVQRIIRAYDERGGSR